MEELKTLKRRMSLEKDFMKYDTDDLLYSSLYYLSTFHPIKNQLYLTKKNLGKNKKIICDICELTTQTFNRHLEKLIDKGLLKEEEITIGEGKTQYPCYTFPYNYTEKYQIVENEMLWYIVSTRNKQAVRVYIYLLNIYKWKQQNKEDYIFTNLELLGALGYSTNSSNQRCNSIINNILESFAREVVIKYETFYEETFLSSGKSVPVPRKRLIFVASSKKELPQIE